MHAYGVGATVFAHNIYTVDRQAALAFIKLHPCRPEEQIS